MAKKTKEQKDAEKAARAAKKAARNGDEGEVDLLAEELASKKLTGEQERVAAARATTGTQHTNHNVKTA